MPSSEPAASASAAGSATACSAGSSPGGGLYPRRFSAEHVRPLIPLCQGERQTGTGPSKAKGGPWAFCYGCLHTGGQAGAAGQAVREGASWALLSGLRGVGWEAGLHPMAKHNDRCPPGRGRPPEGPAALGRACGAGDGWARAAGAPCRAWPSSHVLGLPAETRPETTGSARGPTRCLQPAAASGRRSAVAGAGLHPGERASACVGRPRAPGWIPSTPDLAAQAGQQPPLAGSPSSLQGQPWAAGNDPWVKPRPERHLDSDATVSPGSGPRHPHAQLCTRQRVFFPKLGQTD